MTRARKELVSLDDTPYYHCSTRCVRRAFLCGKDRYTNQDYEHRRAWVVERLAQLADAFSIEVAAYAVMSNHYHVVLRVDRDAANGWSRDEVIERWRKLYCGSLLVQRYAAKQPLSPAELDAVDKDVAIWRERLCDISWFMRCLNEYLARRANAEDGCKGRFWESRFSSQALLDDIALLACMTYVDLNPIRAGMADSPENSDYTSLQARLGIQAQTAITPSSEALSAQQSEGQKSPALPLMPFAGQISEVANASMTNAIPFSLADYLALVDWSGRAVRDDKRGSIPGNLPPILQRLQIAPEQWLKASSGIEKNFTYAIGPIAKLSELCEALNRRWLRGQRACEQLYRRYSHA